ncbi:MAG: NAD-dependent epimerase/dehydratase family protein [Bacteroidales bacterium]|nr:NAD-dependent epimerase/dehydratase family protein [Bacteroidales bacterium]
MKIFVTGGDGLLGSNLVRELLARDHKLTVLVQSEREVSTLDGLNLEKVEGNLLDFESLKAATNEAEAIIHVAANTSLWPSRSKVVNKVNIEGTRNIIRLAKELDVKRLVHVGTANTFGFGTKENPGQEDAEYMGEQYGLDYMDSKWKAHQLVLEAVKEGVPALIVNPTFMFGAYDSAPSSGKIILAVYLQKLPYSAPGGRNYICVKDAAHAIANALEKGRVGESYIIGNENLTYNEVFGKMASVLGVSPPKRSISRSSFLAFGKLCSLIAFITGKKPIVSYPIAKIACDDQYFTAEKAIKELGLIQTPIEEGIQESFEWLKINGYLKK